MRNDILLETGAVFTEHSEAQLAERQLKLSWVVETLQSPNRTDEMLDQTVHYIKRIVAANDKVLRVVVNPAVSPKTIITLFFDRRLRYSL
jgi:hypothetical protein